MNAHRAWPFPLCWWISANPTTPQVIEHHSKHLYILTDTFTQTMSNTALITINMNNLLLHISTEETLALQIVLNNEYALGVSIDTITERKGPV